MTVISDVFVRKGDARICEDVSRQIAWQPEIQSKDISVKATDGTVTLTGFVHTYLEKSAAERAAKSVYGVQAVANDIEVRPVNQRTDPEIARDILLAFKLHASIPEDRIKISVKDGFVTLDGTLDWHFQRERAHHVAQTVTGVRGVIDLILIQPKASTQEVREKIEEAWKRTIDLDARRMAVVATDGSVSLYGRVHSLNEREQAEQAAWQAPGVREVSNHLLVTP